MTYPSINVWYQHVNRLTTPEQLNDAHQELRRGERSTCGIHNFKQTGDMGRAVVSLRNRAAELNFQTIGGEWRYKTATQIEYEAQQARQKAERQASQP